MRDATAGRSQMNIEELKKKRLAELIDLAIEQEDNSDWFWYLVGFISGVKAPESVHPDDWKQQFIEPLADIGAGSTENRQLAITFLQRMRRFAQ